jgi:hypothetical protein
MSDKLFVSDSEIAARLGIKPDIIKEKIELWERSGFPRQDPMFDNKRYWPSIAGWLDRRFGVVPPLQPGNSARNGVRS